ncbi:MAG: alpha-ketoacid dehydrogenase subunit beta [Nanoarchaeota archaeon]
MAIMNMVEALNSALFNIMKQDSNVVILGEDVARDGGVFRVTDNLWKKYPSRVFDTPLAETGIVGASIGLSIAGLKPVAEIQFEGFMFPGFDQLVNHASRIRNRSRGRFTSSFVLRSPFGGGVKALEHHSDSPETYYAHVPGLKLVIPSHPYDAKGLLISSIKDNNSVIFFEPKKIYRSIKEEVPEKYYEIELGKANVLVKGDDLTLITYGAWVKEIVEVVNESKYSIEVIDLRTLKPLDEETIINSVNKTGRCLIINEAPRFLNYSSEIISIINEKCFKNLKHHVERVTGFDTVMPMPKHENYYLPNKARIKYSIEKVIS